MSRPSISLFRPEPLHGRVQDVAPRTSYLTRTLFSFPSRHFFTSPRHWKLGRWSLRRRLVYRKVSSPCRFHLSEPDLTCSSLAPHITLLHKVHASASSSTRPNAFIVIPCSWSIKLPMFQWQFPIIYSSSESHPQRFSFLSRRQTPAPLFPTPFQPVNYGSLFESSSISVHSPTALAFIAAHPPEDHRILQHVANP